MGDIVKLPEREASKGFGVQSLVEFLLSHAVNQWRSIDDCTRPMGRVCENSRKKTRKLMHRTKHELLERYKLALLYEYVPRRGATKGNGKISAVQVFDPVNASPAAKYAAEQLMEQMVKRADATLEELHWLREAIMFLPKKDAS